MAWSYDKFSYAPWNYDSFSYKKYTESDSVSEALKKKKNAENALANSGDFTFSKQGDYDTLYDQYKNRKDFVYDINDDALYQQYKDKYIKQAKMASADVMGQAAAMTGGYGSSYAQTVGNQAYQGQLDNLNDIVPQLYQMALDRYNMQGQEMRDMISLLGDERNFEYGVWGDGYNRLATDRDYYGNQYDSERSWDYGKYTNERDFAYDQYSSDRALSYDQYSSDRNLAYDEYSTDKNLSYDEYRNAIADAQWEKEHALNERQVALQEQKSKDPEEPIEPDEPDYSGWSAADWNSYFERIRNGKDGSAAEAEEELARMIKEGLIPQNMITYAALGARGRLGH